MTYVTPTMTQVITLELPDETAQRYRRSANAARKKLEEFLIERLAEAAPPLVDSLPTPLSEELKALEELDNEALWKVARSQLSRAKQRQYETLLERNRQGNIMVEEKETLHELGEEARRLTLKKAHAYMLLKWRGQAIPTIEQLRNLE
ncbi:MAG: hypothetical protein AB1791_10705 [Chloroflexota bacterium]